MKKRASSIILGGAFIMSLFIIFPTIPTNSSFYTEGAYLSEREAVVFEGEDIAKRTASSYTIVSGVSSKGEELGPVFDEKGNPTGDTRVETIFYPKPQFAKDITNVWREIDYTDLERSQFTFKDRLRTYGSIVHSFFISVAYAVTDTIYSNASGDGYVEGFSTTGWTPAHDATSGTANTGNTTILVGSQHYRLELDCNGPPPNYDNDFYFWRAFLPFDTSGIASAATISSATLNIYVTSKGNDDNDGSDFVTVIRTNQATHTSLASGDYDNTGATDNPTEGVDSGQRKDITSISTSAYLSFTLNATGRGWIAKSGEASNCSSTNGISCFGLREGHDVLDENLIVPVVADCDEGATNSSVTFSSADASGTSQDPYLSVTYTVPDTTAPAAVSNLATSNPTVNSVDLSWTAPGDDNTTGTATTYDVRYSTSVINEGNFNSATQATGEPTPSVAGSSESMTVSGLAEDTTYYFAIKTSDEIPNTSAISNVPSQKTADATAPSAVNDLALSNPSPTSINLSWTAPGDNGGTGTATTYDVRYATSPITAGNFSSATQATGEPTPSVAGSNESMTVSGLSSGITYYFAIKTIDEEANTSAISNVPSLSTSGAVLKVIRLLGNIRLHGVRLY